MLRFTIDDPAAFARRLRALGQAAEKELRPALAELGAEAAHAAREMAPQRSGRLRESIQVEAVADAPAVDVAATAPYAAFVEFGTLRRPARPFLSPSLQFARRRLDVLARALIRAWA
jgi:HK97 gp10 family phage protein